MHAQEMYSTCTGSVVLAFQVGMRVSEPLDRALTASAAMRKLMFKTEVVDLDRVPMQLAATKLKPEQTS